MIVASGPSAKDAPLDRVAGWAKIVAVNESWRLCQPDMIYACDGAWWRANNGLPGFAGIKVTQEARAASDYGLHKVTVAVGCDRMLFGEVGLLGSGSNSGFQALNLVAQLGASRILLVGYDMNLANGIHWHGMHPQGLNNPRESLVARWLAADWTMPKGIEVVNCNPASALDAYPKMKFEDACSLYL